MSTQNSSGKLTSILGQVVSVIPNSYSFRGDDRYHAVTSVLLSEDVTGLEKKISGLFHARWDHTNLEGAAGAVQALLRELQGMRPGQILYTEDLSANTVGYAAMWPWNNGKRVSLRLGVHAVDMASHDLIEYMRVLKQATGVQGPVPDKSW